MLPRAIEPIRAHSRGSTRRRPRKLHADKGYGYRHLRLALRKRRSIPRGACCGVEPKHRLGRYRWVVERPRSWLDRFRRLKTCCEQRADMHLAFVQLSCTLISLGFLGAPVRLHIQLVRTVNLDRRALPLLH